MVVGVLVILGMTLITFINPMTQIFRGYDTVRKTDLSKLKAAFESYYEDKGCYPPIEMLQNCGGTDLAPYMDKIPCDPSTGEAYELFYHPVGETCSQRFVIYTTLANVFDPAGKEIPYCDNTYAVKSSDVTEAIVITGCSGRQLCSRLYGCVSGQCQLIAEDSFPVCYPSYCDDNTCNNKCSNPSYECVSQ